MNAESTQGLDMETASGLTDDILRPVISRVTGRKKATKKKQKTSYKTGYSYFFQFYCKNLKGKRAGTFADISRECSYAWKRLDSQHRAKFNRMAAINKIRQGTELAAKPMKSQTKAEGAHPTEVMTSIYASDWFVKPDEKGVFNCMVVGEHAIGKSSFINSLFMAELLSCGKQIPTEAGSSKDFETSCVEINDKGRKVKFSFIESPGFDQDNDSHSKYSIIQTIDLKLDNYIRKEINSEKDSRIHACFYLVPPCGLKASDVIFMKKLQDSVNLIPIIAKSDSIMKEKIIKLKEHIMEQIDENGIAVYSPIDEDPKQVEQFKTIQPFAISPTFKLFDVGGQPTLARLFKKNSIHIHCDFPEIFPFLFLHSSDESFYFGHFFYLMISQPFKKDLIHRNITAHDGIIVDQLAEHVNFVITDSKWAEWFDDAILKNNNLVFIKPEWVEKCNSERKFVAYQRFIITPD